MKEDFPIFSRMINGRPLVYLDNAATTQKPACVIDAMSDYYSSSNANVHRAVHTLAGEATEGYEACRKMLKKRFNSRYAVITSGTTEAINLVAHAWGEHNLNDGDVIVLTEMEHHSDIVPWQMLAERKSIELRYVPVTDGELDLDAFRVALEGAKLVCVVHTSNVLGIRNPIEDIISISQKSGARVLIDAAQAVPHEEIDFDKLGADFMAFSAHKMCGPTGIGALLVNESSFNEMEPFMGGGDMIETVTTEGSTYQSNEHRFEAGTPRIAEGFGWAAALEWLESVDLKSHHSRLLKIANRVAEELRSKGMKVYSSLRPGDAAVISFTHPTIHPEDFARLLDAQGIAVRTGHHCAQPLMERLGVTGTIRASFYVYNDESDADIFLDGVDRVMEAMQ
ncbi:MAG: SufS family cysteine desulfurase [Candidatus Thermoplasmatota archaeon]|nr:cysteine desulfurase [Euryarchaeota archaeon]MEE2985188.1 SufS family cysteine desulfurase [Candidatus Thermoplasmatota archaeon]|tara:strand:- start:1112 stop:2296 length:1185 start_codon:yes stop_codon:yes gene_type:complete